MRKGEGEAPFLDNYNVGECAVPASQNPTGNTVLLRILRADSSAKDRVHPRLASWRGGRGPARRHRAARDRHGWLRHGGNGTPRPGLTPSQSVRLRAIV